MSRCWNKVWIGLALGLILPLAVFIVFYFVMYSHFSIGEYLAYSAKIRTLPKLLSLCAIPNLITFYLFLNKEYWYATRGVIAATLLYTFGIVAIKIFC
jgi:hypothetical protein